MITYAIMGLIVLFLAFELLYKAEYRLDAVHLFDKQNSNAMRGFWCLIVILVHIPAAYQNRIQDMLGSFAYIGVTFFFMTSAYGLRLGIEKDPDSIRVFWRRRLARLLVPMFLVNIVSLIFQLIERNGIFPITLININGWVQWLIVCYVIFWAVYRFVNAKLSRLMGDIVICMLIIAFSATVYLLKKHISATTWCPEIFGFVWGIIFYHIKKRFSDWMNKEWFLKCVAFCLIAGIAGIAYLKLKPVVFFGDYLLKIMLGVLIITFMLAVNSHIVVGNKVNLFLGSISYEVYLLQHIVFGFISFIMPRVSSGTFIGASIFLTVLIATAISRVKMKLSFYKIR